MDALARTLPRRIHHVPDQRQRHSRRSTPDLQKLLVRPLHISQTVDVQLEDLRRVLGTDAVTGTQVLVDPDLQLLAADTGLLLHGHLPCR